MGDPLLRRALPVAVAAAAFVLVPTTASATPAQAPVENMFSAGYYATAEMVLSDGRLASVSLSEYRGASQDGWHGSLGLSVRRDANSWQAASGYAQVTDEQVDFRRNLGGASAIDIPVTLVTYGWGPTGPTQTKEDVIVSVVFTGTGDVTRETYRGDMCGDGGRTCQSVRVGAHREATGELLVDGLTGTGVGSLSYGQGVDVAAPKYQEGYYN
jgi:hypothetical protein